jgi:hypothetical protein
MGVNNPRHATLRHEDLRVGEDVIADGEKVRPNYLGTILDLGTVIAPNSSKLVQDALRHE